MSLPVTFPTKLTRLGFNIKISIINIPFFSYNSINAVIPGLNVREKAKQLVNLLKDEERLKNERARALKAKQRFAQSASAFGSDGALDTPTSPTYPAVMYHQL